MEIAEVAGCVGELAAHSILAEALSGHVALAERHAEFAGDVRLLHELVLTVSERALRTKFAVLAIQPKLAHFSLLFLLVSGLKSGHVFRGEVLWLVDLRYNSWHPEGGSGGRLENLGCRLELCEGRLHHGLRSKEALALGLCETPLILSFIVG